MGHYDTVINITHNPAAAWRELRHLGFISRGDAKLNINIELDNLNSAFIVKVEDKVDSGGPENDEDE